MAILTKAEFLKTLTNDIVIMGNQRLSPLKDNPEITFLRFPISEAQYNIFGKTITERGTTTTIMVTFTDGSMKEYNEVGDFVKKSKFGTYSLLYMNNINDLSNTVTKMEVIAK